MSSSIDDIVNDLHKKKTVTKTGKKEKPEDKPEDKLKDEQKKKQDRLRLVLLLLFIIVIAGTISYFAFYKQPVNYEVKSKPVRKELTILEAEKSGVSSGLRSADSVSDETPMVQAVKYLPSQPLVGDTIRAEVSLNYEGKERVTYRYQWKVNNKIVEGAEGDALPPGPFKKNDMVSVRVVPLIQGKEGYAYENAFVIVRNSPPTIEMKEKRQKSSDSMEFQLAASDPDNDKITYALEEPLLEGMTINKDTGLVTWKPKKKERGVYRFRASAAEADGSKASATFEFSLDTK